MSAEQKVVQQFQWVKSDKAGTVVEFKSKDEQWTNFTDGSRIANELIGEYLLPVRGEPIPMTDLNNVDAAPIPAINPKQRQTPNPKAEPLTSPIAILFNKQKKNDKIKLKIELPVEVPKKTIYEVIESSFDIEEVQKELEKFVSGQLDKKEINNLVNKAIQNLIQERYKGSGTSKTV